MAGSALAGPSRQRLIPGRRCFTGSGFYTFSMCSTMNVSDGIYDTNTTLDIRTTRGISGIYDTTHSNGNQGAAYEAEVSVV